MVFDCTLNIYILILILITATVHEDTVKNVLLLLVSASKPFFTVTLYVLLSSRKVLVLVLEPYKSLNTTLVLANVTYVVVIVPQLVTLGKEKK